MNAKRARERELLEEVRSLCSDFPSGEVLDAEAPDFLIPTDAGPLGVELVEYIRGQSTDGA